MMSTLAYVVSWTVYVYRRYKLFSTSGFSYVVCLQTTVLRPYQLYSCYTFYIVEVLWFAKRCQFGWHTTEAICLVLIIRHYTNKFGEIHDLSDIIFKLSATENGNKLGFSINQRLRICDIYYISYTSVWSICIYIYILYIYIYLWCVCVFWGETTKITHGWNLEIPHRQMICIDLTCSGK